jgi:hypothetical protein
MIGLGEGFSTFIDKMFIRRERRGFGGDTNSLINPTFLPKTGWTQRESDSILSQESCSSTSTFWCFQIRNPGFKSSLPQLKKKKKKTRAF